MKCPDDVAEVVEEGECDQPDPSPAQVQHEPNAAAGVVSGLPPNEHKTVDVNSSLEGDGEIEDDDDQIVLDTNGEIPVNEATPLMRVYKGQSMQPLGHDPAAKVPSACIICTLNSPKYTCPKCDRRTCSLDCVNKHKTQFECSGEKPEYKSLKQFYCGDLDEFTLVQDYRFLEKGVRQKEQRKAKTSDERKDGDCVPFGQPTQFRYKLVKECKQRHIHLCLMPAGFTRPKVNTSNFEPFSESIQWTVQLRVIDPDSDKQVSITCHKVLESVSVWTIINQFISGRSRRSIVHDVLDQDSANLLTELVAQAKGEGEDDYKAYWAVLRRVEKCKDECYQLVDVSQSLSQCLMHSTVIEYPSLLVLPKSKLSQYDIVSENKRLELYEQTEKEQPNEGGHFSRGRGGRGLGRGGRGGRDRARGQTHRGRGRGHHNQIDVDGAAVNVAAEGGPVPPPPMDGMNVSDGSKGRGQWNRGRGPQHGHIGGRGAQQQHFWHPGNAAVPGRGRGAANQQTAGQAQRAAPFRGYANMGQRGGTHQADTTPDNMHMSHPVHCMHPNVQMQQILAQPVPVKTDEKDNIPECLGSLPPLQRAAPAVQPRYTHKHSYEKETPRVVVVSGHSNEPISEPQTNSEVRKTSPAKPPPKKKAKPTKDYFSILGEGFDGDEDLSD